jgi:hypothetical protein
MALCILATPALTRSVWSIRITRNRTQEPAHESLCQAEEFFGLSMTHPTLFSVSPRYAGVGVVLAFLFTVAPAAAQTSLEQRRFTVGIEGWVRSDDWNNAIDMSDKTNDQRDQLRDRTRLWVDAPVTGLFDVSFGASMENTQRVGLPKQFNEVFFDQANITLRKLGMKGFSLKVGRQDIMKGEGFLIWDGTPGDGPRSIYFNAAVLSYKRGKSQLDLIGIADPARDHYLPVLHDQHRLIQSWDEQALGTYFTTRHFANTTLESYYFLKKEFHDVLAPSNPQFQPDRHVSTAGGRVSMKVDRRTDMAAEYARQWGMQHGGAAIAGWGGYGWVKHTLDRRLLPYIKVGYWAMSGDDAKTRDKVEGWDPLFSQYPKWSDSYVYTLSKENGTAYWSNLRMSQFEAGFSPVPKTTLSFIWYHMNSFHPSAGSPATFGTGTGRGEHLQWRLEYNPTPAWKTYLHVENHRPGDFYAAGRAAAYEVQIQAAYRFTFHPLARW